MIIIITPITLAKIRTSHRLYIGKYIIFSCINCTLLHINEFSSICSKVKGKVFQADCQLEQRGRRFLYSKERECAVSALLSCLCYWTLIYQILQNRLSLHLINVSIDTFVSLPKSDANNQSSKINSSDIQNFS